MTTEPTMAIFALSSISARSVSIMAVMMQMTLHTTVETRVSLRRNTGVCDMVIISFGTKW